MRTSVALIGFMACGKSSVGRMLAPMLGLRFVDLDERIESDAGKPISAIFLAEGEAGFRHRERDCLAVAANDEKILLSCGGGIVVDAENRTLLRTRFRVVWISINAEEAVRRAAFSKGSRPLLDHPDPVARAREMLAFREEFYRQSADYIVSTDASCTIQSIAEKIHEYLSTAF